MIGLGTRSLKCRIEIASSPPTCRADTVGLVGRPGELVPTLPPRSREINGAKLYL